jgi:anti-sigma28 factor (negative regulator of flagellin synthesis)
MGFASLLDTVAYVRDGYRNMGTCADGMRHITREGRYIMSRFEHDLPNEVRQCQRMLDEDADRERWTTEPEVSPESESQAPLSQERETQRVKQVVEEAPDIREDRVAAARQALKQGRLNLRGAELAERLLQDELHRADPEV